MKAQRMTKTEIEQEARRRLDDGQTPHVIAIGERYEGCTGVTRGRGDVHADQAVAREMLRVLEASGPVRVVSAAVKMGAMVYSMQAPARHHNILHEMHERGVSMDTPSAVTGQGFLLSCGTWVDREKARVIAERAGQLLDRAGNSSMLFSEDVW